MGFYDITWERWLYMLICLYITENIASETWLTGSVASSTGWSLIIFLAPFCIPKIAADEGAGFEPMNWLWLIVWEEIRIHWARRRLFFLIFCKWLQVATSGCKWLLKWLQVAAFAKFKIRVIGTLSGFICISKLFSFPASSDLDSCRHHPDQNGELQLVWMVPDKDSVEPCYHKMLKLSPESVPPNMKHPP